jgi:hypothetical protein
MTGENGYLFREDDGGSESDCRDGVAQIGTGCLGKVCDEVNRSLRAR